MVEALHPPGELFCRDEGTLSIDGNHMVYGAQKGKKWLVIMDGKEGPEYQAIMEGGPIFHEDGSIEYLALKKYRLYRVTIEP